MSWRAVVLASLIACGKAKSGGGGSAAPDPAPASSGSEVAKTLGCKPGSRPPIGFQVEPATPLPDGHAIYQLGRLGDGRLVALSEDGQKPNALFLYEGGRWSEVALPPAMAGRRIWVEITSTSIVITGSMGHRSRDEPQHLWLWQASNRQWSDVGTRGVEGGKTVALPDGRVLFVGGEKPDYRERDGRYERPKLPAVAHVLSPKGIEQTESQPGEPEYYDELISLRDGRVMSIRGAKVTLWNPKDGTWTATGSLAHPRTSQSVTELPDGRVLVIGGSYDDKGVLEIEQWSPSTKTWRVVGKLTEPRTQHTATVLADCRVVITGGFVPAISNDTSPEALTTEVWNAVDNTIDAQLAAQTRVGHSVLAEPDGTLLVAVGEVHGSGGTRPELERWRPIAKPSSHLAIESLDWPYKCQPLVQLTNGDIVLVGGNMRWSKATNTLSPTAKPPVPLGNVAVALSDQSVLALSLDQRTLWRLTKNTWSAAGKLVIPEQEETRLFPDEGLPFQFTMTALPDGRVFLAGGDADQVWDDGKLAPSRLPSEWRRGHATALVGDQVVILGGVYRTQSGGPSNPPAKVTTIFWPADDAVGTTDVPFEAATDNQSAILLADNTVLVTGGATSHIYEPEPDTFRPVGKMAVARRDPALVRLPDGRVLALGGEEKGTQPIIELYDPKAATWTTLGPLPETWTSPSAVVLGPNRVAVVAEGRAIVLVLK
jgi:hypothetical protein